MTRRKTLGPPETERGRQQILFWSSHREHGPAAILILGSWLQNCERINICYNKISIVLNYQVCGNML
jgi:hypothetical protein